MEKLIALFERLREKLGGLEGFHVKTLDGKIEGACGPSGILLKRCGYTVAQTGRYGPWAEPGATEEAEVALEELAQAPHLFVRWVDWESATVHEARLPNPLLED